MATLLHDRTVRNAIEHADETFHGALVNKGEGPPAWELASGTGPDPRDDDTDEFWAMQPRPMRTFNVSTFELTILSKGTQEMVNLRELAVATEALPANLEAELARHREGLISGEHHEKFFQ